MNPTHHATERERVALALARCPTVAAVSATAPQRGADYKDAADQVLAVISEPDTTPTGLELCRVCRAPRRPKEERG